LTIDSSSQAILSPKARDTLRADCRTRLPETVNSYQPTIAPVLTIDGKYLFIDRKIHPDNSGGIYDQDEIWLSEKVGENGWSEPERLNTSFNTSGSDVLFSISPDGSRFVFISFPADIPSGDHPYYKHCYLRLMPITGGTPKVIAYLYGGQGTMNVPSWSPDGRRLAFVSYQLQ